VGQNIHLAHEPGVAVLFTGMSGREILRSSQRLENSLGSWLSPKVHRGFIVAR
jgi:hypothetical protein